MYKRCFFTFYMCKIFWTRCQKMNSPPTFHLQQVQPTTCMHQHYCGSVMIHCRIVYSICYRQTWSHITCHQHHHHCRLWISCALQAYKQLLSEYCQHWSVTFYISLYIKIILEHPFWFTFRMCQFTMCQFAWYAENNLMKYI